MIKKLKTFLFSLFFLFTLFGCNNVTYSFYDVTGYQISEINNVSYNYGPMQSLQLEFKGDYNRFLDTNYIKVDDNKALEEYLNVRDNYRFCFCVEYYESKYEEIGPSHFYIYNNRIYTLGNDENFYKSENYVSLIDLRNEAEDIEPYSETISSNYTNRLSLTVNYDYGLHIENKATLLLDGILPFFDPKDYSIDNLVAGDILEISYNGEFIIRETYPATLDKSSCEIVSIELTEAEIYEFELLAIPGSGQLDLVPLDHSIYNATFETEYVINEDGTYQSYKELSYGTKIYGTIPKTRNSFNMMALYSYNPRDNKEEEHFRCVKFYQEPTCLDEGFYIVGCYCCEADTYIPIEKVSCSYDENNVCIWCKSNKPISYNIRVSSNVIDGMKYIINTKEDFDALIDMCNQNNLYETQPILESYNEDYFISSSLVAITEVEGSGSISFDVKSVKIEDNSINVDIERNVPFVGNCDMAYWLILIEIDQKIPNDYILNVRYFENDILN